MEETEKSLIKRNKKSDKDKILLIVIVVAIVLIDQITKLLVINKGEMTIIPKVLNFKVSQNSLRLKTL